MTQPLDQWIREKEGLRLKCYTDTHGNLTIGIGHNLTAKGITIAQADMLLAQDIDDAKRDVVRSMAWVLDLDPARQDAVYHLCFWIGIGSLLLFTQMLTALHAENWQEAHDQLLDSHLFRDIPERTTEIANRLLNGTTP